MRTTIERKRRDLDLNKLLGHRLALLRREAGIKQEDVADAMSYNRSLVSKIENGHRALSAIEIPDYAAAINVAPGRIVAEIHNIVVEYDGGGRGHE